MIRSIKKTYTFLLHQDKSLYRAFASITSLRVVEKACGLAISIMIFRHLSKEDVAAFGFIQTIVAICAIFGLQELQNTISQSISRGHFGTYLKSVPMAFFSSLIGSLVLAGFAGWYFMAEQEKMGYGFLVAAAIFPFFQGLRQWRGLYLGQSKFSTFAKAEASNAIFKTALIAVALYMFPHEILWPLLISFAVPAVQNCLRTYSSYKAIEKDATYEEGSLEYGFKANLYSAVAIIANNIDKVILFTFLSPASLAIYMAAEKFADLLQGVMQDIGAILAPKFAKIGQYSTALDNKLKILAMMMAAAMLAFALLILPYLLPLVLGQSYDNAVIFSQILVIGAAIRTIATLRFRFVRSKVDAESFRQVTIYSALGHIAASIVLVPTFGLYGAVASVVIHRMVLSFTVDRIIKKKYLAHEQ